VKKILAKILLFTLLFNLFPSFWWINNVSANDTDWTANLNLTLNSNIDASSIIWDNFVYNFSLKNENDSEATAYKNGFILNLPKDEIDFISSSDLGSPTRTVINWNRKLLFFQTDDFLLTWSTNWYNVTLKSLNSANLLQNYELSILAYADDSIYGRWAVPDWAPAWTLSGWVDLANSVNDPSDLSFPDNIDENTDLSTLPFISNQTKFIPFDIEKTWEWVWLIWHTHVNTITIKWNSLWDLKNFSIKDVIPNNRKFVWFTQTGWVSNISVVYNSPNSWETTLYMSWINVSVWTDLEIKYETLSLAFPISSYSWTNIILNTGSVIADRTPSENKVIQLQEWTWNNWSSDIAVDSTTLVPERSHIEHLWYAKISKSVTWPMWVIDWVQQAVIWDLLTYTINLNVARNVAFNTNWSWTYITDIVPDWLSFSGVISSVNNWVWNALTFVSSNTDANWDTTLLWKLDSWEIKADDDLVIVYQAVVDWLYEWSWDTEFENTETLTNYVTFLGTISDSQNNEEWGYTDSSLIDSTVSYTTSSSVKAPDPTNKKYIVKITTPDATVYDNTTGLPSNIPVWSEIQYALVMAFPNVNFLNAKVIDALPLIVWPNDEVYDYAFQTDINLKDINWTLIEINDDDNDWSADSVFNWKDLTSTWWINETPANNVEFDLGSWSWNKIFSVLFKVKVLDIKPDSNSSWLAPLKNVSFASVNDDQATINNLEIQDVELELWVPELTLTKTISGSNIEAWSFIDYKVEINNIWKQTAYIEDLIDILPDNLTLDSYLITGSWFTVSSSSLTQSGNNLTISFDESNGRSVLWAWSWVIIDYRVKTETGLIINNQNKINTVNLDYYASDTASSDGLHNYWPLEDSSSFITKQPTITRTLISTSESGSTSNNVEIWETATYRTIITLPQGTYNNSSFVYSNDSNLEFITGSVVSNSWSLSFSTWTWFIWNTADFGTIINSDNDDSTQETIVLESTFKVSTWAINNSIENNNWQFNYNWNSINKTNSLNIVEPNIVLNKSVNPITWNAWDTLNYTINLNNSWNANAYDLVLKDNLDSRLTFVTWSLVLNWFSGSEVDFLWSTWIVLDKLNSWTSTWVTFQVIVNQNVAPQDSIPNTANLTYTSLDADNSLDEKNYSVSSSVNYSINDINLEHNIISTNNPGTATGKFNVNLYDLAIWEEATYKTKITFPESTSTGFVVTQTLPVWYEFLTGSVVVWDLSSSLSWITINNNIITYTFNPIVVNAWSWSKVLELLSNLVVKNTTVNAWQEEGLSTLEANWDNSHSKSITTNLDIVEPNLLITKEYDILTGDAWDIAQTTIIITNNGTAPAYDLSWTDEQPNNVTSSGSYYSSSWASVLNIWDTITYTYETILGSGVSAWDILTWTASIDYTSMPWINSNERTYNTYDTDSIQVVVNWGLVATLNTTQNVAIWDVSNYTIKVPISEWTTDSIKIEDLLPSWIAIDTGSIVITHNSITYSWSEQPTFTSTGMFWEFTNVVNSDNNNSQTEEIIINFNTVLLNTSNNNTWDTKTHQVKALYNWWNEKNATTNNIVVVEPNLGLNISNTYNQASKQVKYTFTITNTWTTSAFDLDLTTLLASWVTYTWSINITNTWWVENLTRIWNIIKADKLQVNTWNPLTFEIYADVDENHNLWDTLTLTWNLVYTSQAWNYNPVVSNSDNTERNGDGWINDYKTSDTTSFVYQDAILNEKIEVVDDNWWDHLGWEVYTYTVTLTNSWNVDLTDISTTINIPEYLSWATFSLQSVPAWSTNSYSSTWGTYNNWILTLSGINISVGDSVTIVYKINAKKDTPDGTTITTVANVSDTSEWAIWWDPSVDLTIVAPKLETTSIITDDNWGSLYPNELLTHKSTIKNIWSATWTNMQVVLTYNTWTVSYISGSLDFASWTLVDTWSIVINENAWTISFTITSIAPNILEEVTFKTKATWPVWSKVKTVITAKIDEGFDSTTTSNELVIVSIPVVSSGWGGWWWSSRDRCSNWDYSGSYYDWKCWVKPSDEKENSSEDKVDDKKEKDKKIDKKEIKTIKVDISKYEAEYEKLVEKQKRLEELLQEDKQEIKQWFVLPKVLPKTWTPIEKRTYRRKVSSIDVDFPSKEIFRLAWSNNSDINYWKQVLPKEDKNRDEYVVIPSNGLVIPVNKVPENTADFTQMVSGQEIHVNDYLKSWAMEYPRSWKLGKPWNKVIFGHSSYWKNDDGRYKTHFGKIIELDSGEEVWVYKKDENGEFKRYRYKVTNSYNTKPTDVWVLKPTKKSTLTMFTCTPIWGIAGRWIIKADYIDPLANEKQAIIQEKQKLEKELYWTDVSVRYKLAINKLIRKINKISWEKRKEIIVKVIDRIDILLSQDKYKNNKKIVAVLKYLRTKLLRELFEK